MLSKVWRCSTFGYNNSLSVGGESLDAGFSLHVHSNAGESECSFETSGFRERALTIEAWWSARSIFTNFLLKNGFEFIAYIIISGISAYVAHRISLLLVVANILLALSIGQSARKTFLRYWHGIAHTQLGQWHALEHKTAFLLEQGIVPTREQVKGAHKTLLRCGDSLASIILQGKFAWWVLLHATGWISVVAALWVASAGAAWLVAMLSMLPGSSEGGPYIYFALGLPACLVALAWERCISISEPTEEQTDEALRVTREFLETYPGILEV